VFYIRVVFRRALLRGLHGAAPIAACSRVRLFDASAGYILCDADCGNWGLDDVGANSAVEIDAIAVGQAVAGAGSDFGRTTNFWTCVDVQYVWGPELFTLY